MRPIYENRTTMQNEQDFARSLEKLLLCNLVKCPRNFHIDFAAVRNAKVVSFIEFRKRSNSMDYYPTFMTAANKKICAQAINRSSSLPVYMFVQWTDHLGYVDLVNCQADWSVGGRKDRNDPADFEPVIQIPLTEFKKI